MCRIHVYVESAKYGVKELKSCISYIALSFDFMNKPPSQISPPPLESPKLNMPPGA